MQEEEKIITIAFDDIDNRVGGCTTHFTTLFLLEASRYIEHIADYPLLVRLNPNIPWKTRGNASTALRLFSSMDPGELLEIASWMAEEYTQGRPRATGKKPGIVVAEGKVWSDPAYRGLYREALTGVISVEKVARFLERRRALYHGGRGIVGAAAALGALAPGELYTFELIAYRNPDNWEKPREISWSPTDSGFWPSCTFNNVDWLESRPSFAPGGWDPVLYGLRGYCPAMGLCDITRETPDVCTLFRSNQHSGPHNKPLTPRFTPYSVGVATVTIESNPLILPKGHTIVKAKAYGKPVDLAFFRETWPLNKVARSLAPGDTVMVLVQVKPYSGDSRPLLAVEHMEVISLSRDARTVNPRCPLCGLSMKSMGSSGGFKCTRCGYRSRLIRGSIVEQFRVLVGGKYTVRPGRYPHLSSPRYIWGVPRIELPLRLQVQEIVFINRGVYNPLVSNESH